MGLFKDPRVEMLMHQVSSLENLVQTLQKDVRYYADQPQYTGFFASNAYSGIDFNLVPLNKVVEAIVKHLDMQIEKVAEHTYTKPVEVKVVPKQPSVTITGSEGTTAVWSNPNPPPKPKRKYTKRKSK